MYFSLNWQFTNNVLLIIRLLPKCWATVDSGKFSKFFTMVCSQAISFSVPKTTTYTWNHSSNYTRTSQSIESKVTQWTGYFITCIAAMKSAVSVKRKKRLSLFFQCNLKDNWWRLFINFCACFGVDTNKFDRPY